MDVSFALIKKTAGLETEHTDMVPAEIGYLIDTKLLWGGAAWQELLRRHPDFRELSWIAQKLGLTETLAQGMRLGAKLVRSLCLTCGRQTSIRSR